MARLVLGALLVAAAVLLAGCTSRERGGTDADDEAAEASPTPGPLGRFYGFVPGVDSLPLPDPAAPGFAEGYVYDLATGQPLEGAVVTVSCFAEEAGVTTLLTSLPLPSGDDGGFVVSGVGLFSLCDEVRYEVEVGEYTLLVPLTSPGIPPGFQQIVYAGMLPPA